MDKISTFAKRLQTLMDIQGLSGSEIASKCDINKSNITRYLSGKYKAKEEVVHKIATTFSVNEKWLNGYDVPMNASVEDTPGEFAEFMELEDILSPQEANVIRLYRRADEIDKATVKNILSRYENATNKPPVTYIRHFLTPAAAGYASPIEGQDYEMMPLPANAPSNADYCITVQGDSMEPYIKDGQIVYVKSGVMMQEFDVGVFYLDGDVYCKQWCVDYAGTLHLLSANPKREDANKQITKNSGRTCICFGKVLLRQRLPQPYYEK